MKKLFAFALVAVSLSACNPGPSPECTKLLACAEKLSPGSASTLKATYDTGGACWTTSTAAADACTSACKNSLSSLAAAAPNEAACK